jgi:predicted nucleic acid-binding protein
MAIRSLGKDSPLWLSAVVLAELYSGARGKAARAVQRLDRDFSRIGRVLVPMLIDWREAGRALSRISQRYDYEPRGRARLMSDALIAMSARRMGITVLTANERDFARIAEIRPFQWQLARGAASDDP